MNTMTFPFTYFSQVGRCKSLHVLTLRENELIELPEEIGQLEELTVLDIAGNKLTYLPISLSNLKNLDALWIDGSQVWLSALCGAVHHSLPTCFLAPATHKSSG